MVQTILPVDVSMAVISVPTVYEETIAVHRRGSTLDYHHDRS